jgi:hypothetical protein
MITEQTKQAKNYDPYNNLNMTGKIAKFLIGGKLFHRFICHGATDGLNTMMGKPFGQVCRTCAHYWRNK